MKKLFCLILIAICLLLPGVALAAGDVVQTAADVSSHVRTLIFTCTGDSGDGSIPDTVTNTANTAYIQGWYLYMVDAFPTSGGVAPDAASVTIFDANGLDLLGSENSGITEYAGLNLIHAASPRRCLPNVHLNRGNTHAAFSPAINGALTLQVADQATHSAEYTLVLTFVR